MSLNLDPAAVAAMDETQSFRHTPAPAPVWKSRQPASPQPPDRPEFAALARFLAVRDAPHGGRALRRAEQELIDALRLPTDLDRVRDAFTQRLARQKAQGDVKGATATQSAIRLIDETTR